MVPDISSGCGHRWYRVAAISDAPPYIVENYTIGKDQQHYVYNVLFVPPTSFDPPPRVDSAIVRMVPHAVPPVVDVALLSELVQVAFSQRRKLLRHTLGQWLTARGFTGAFDVQRRAQEVSVAEYVALTQQVMADSAL